MLRGWAHFLNRRLVVIASTIVVMHLAVSIAIAVSVVKSLLHYAIDLFFLLLCIRVCPCLIVLVYYDYLHANVMIYLLNNGELVYLRSQRAHFLS